MATGTVKNVNDARGFGFIRANEGGVCVEHFFHVRDLVDGLEFGEELVGQQVEFTLGIDERSGRERAKHVRAAR